MKLPRHNKKGITLVEVIVGVFVLSIFALGILSLLIYNNQAVSDSAVEKVDYSAAVQKLDMIIAAVANTELPKDDAPQAEKDACFLKKNGSGDITLDHAKLGEVLSLDSTIWNIEPKRDPSDTTKPLRGWYITLTYTVKRTEHGTETPYSTVVKGYASFSQGAFDK